MRNKTVVVLDNDMIARIERDPEEFVRQLKYLALNMRKRPLYVQSAQVGSVAWCGQHAENPTLRIEGLKAEIVGESDDQSTVEAKS